MADQNIHQQLDELKKKLAHIEHLLKSPDGQGMIYFVNIENADVKGPVVDKLEYTFDKLDVKEVSGALNLGNNFGVNVEGKSKKKQPQHQGKNPSSQSQHPSQKHSDHQQHKNLSVSSKKEKESDHKHKQPQSNQQIKPLAVSEKTKHRRSETDARVNSGETHQRKEVQPSLDVSQMKNKTPASQPSNRPSANLRKELKASAKEEHGQDPPRKKMAVNNEEQELAKQRKPLKQRLKKSIAGRAADPENSGENTPFNAEDEKAETIQNQQRKKPFPDGKPNPNRPGHSTSVDQTKKGFSIKFD